MNNNKKKKKVFTIIGARPQFIKASTVSQEFIKSNFLSERIIHTGQHYDANMSDVFFEELNIPKPFSHLGFGGGSHGEMTGKMLEALDRLFIEEKPDLVLVYGDTNSTIAGGLAAAKLHIPIAHVEAGLRSFNKKMPEEVNRVLTDHVSSLLFCPTDLSVKNLMNEGITENVFNVGDVMYDATLSAIKRIENDSSTLYGINLKNTDYAVCTLHRAENTDDPLRLKKLIDFIEEKTRKYMVIFPVHPRTKKALAAAGITTIDGVKMISPLGYLDLQKLLAYSQLILTDSGGLQKEAYFHRVPCITLRDETEWVETIESGWNRLWTNEQWKSPATEITDYGTGKTSETIVKIIKNYLLDS